MNLVTVIETLKTFKPISIFLYGSQASNTQNKNSDYEIGVVFKDDEYVARSEIKVKIPNKKFSIFPFKLGNLQNHSFESHSPKNIEKISHLYYNRSNELIIHQIDTYCNLFYERKRER